MSNHPIVLAISGASGAIYGKEIFDRLHKTGVEINVVITSTAEKIIEHELAIDKSYFEKDGVTIFENSNFDVSIASGSYLTGGMVIAPCSMGCLGRIAGSVSFDLVGRSADVHLKEGRQLILLLRETPLSAIHLENMLKLSRAGATILPAMPSFYNRPQTIDDLAKEIAGKVFDQLGLKQSFAARYNGNE